MYNIFMWAQSRRENTLYVPFQRTGPYTNISALIIQRLALVPLETCLVYHHLGLQQKD